MRYLYGHRLVDVAGIGDWCLGCGAGPDPTIECRPGAPRCDYGCGLPADVNHGGMRSCLDAQCMSSRRVAV